MVELQLYRIIPAHHIYTLVNRIVRMYPSRSSERTSIPAHVLESHLTSQLLFPSRTGRSLPQDPAMINKLVCRTCFQIDAAFAIEPETRDEVVDTAFNRNSVKEFASILIRAQQDVQLQLLFPPKKIQTVLCALLNPFPIHQREILSEIFDVIMSKDGHASPRGFVRDTQRQLVPQADPPGRFFFHSNPTPIRMILALTSWRDVQTGDLIIGKNWESKKVTSVNPAPAPCTYWVKSLSSREGHTASFNLIYSDSDLSPTNPLIVVREWCPSTRVEFKSVPSEISFHSTLTVIRDTLRLIECLGNEGLAGLVPHDLDRRIRVAGRGTPERALLEKYFAFREEIRGLDYSFEQLCLHIARDAPVRSPVLTSTAKALEWVWSFGDRQEIYKKFAEPVAVIHQQLETVGSYLEELLSSSTIGINAQLLQSGGAVMPPFDKLGSYVHALCQCEPHISVDAAELDSNEDQIEDFVELNLFSMGSGRGLKPIAGLPVAVRRKHLSKIGQTLLALGRNPDFSGSVDTDTLDSLLLALSAPPQVAEIFRALSRGEPLATILSVIERSAQINSVFDLYSSSIEAKDRLHLTLRGVQDCLEVIERSIAAHAVDAYNNLLNSSSPEERETDFDRRIFFELEIVHARSSSLLETLRMSKISDDEAIDPIQDSPENLRSALARLRQFQTLLEAHGENVEFVRVFHHRLDSFLSGINRVLGMFSLAEGAESTEFDRISDTRLEPFTGELAEEFAEFAKVFRKMPGDASMISEGGVFNYHEPASFTKLAKLGAQAVVCRDRDGTLKGLCIFAPASPSFIYLLSCRENARGLVYERLVMAWRTHLIRHQISWGEATVHEDNVRNWMCSFALGQARPKIAPHTSINVPVEIKGQITSVPTTFWSITIPASRRRIDLCTRVLQANPKSTQMVEVTFIGWLPGLFGGQSDALVDRKARIGEILESAQHGGLGEKRSAKRMEATLLNYQISIEKLLQSRDWPGQTDKASVLRALLAAEDPLLVQFADWGYNREIGRRVLEEVFPDYHGALAFTVNGGKNHDMQHLYSQMHNRLAIISGRSQTAASITVGSGGGRAVEDGPEVLVRGITFLRKLSWQLKPILVAFCGNDFTQQQVEWWSRDGLPVLLLEWFGGRAGELANSIVWQKQNPSVSIAKNLSSAIKILETHQVLRSRTRRMWPFSGR